MVCQTILKKAKDKNPIGNDGTKTLHLADQNGHLTSESTDDINLVGVTPLHDAVKVMQIC